MNKPTSNIPEIQKRIDRVSEIFARQSEEDIFWLRWQGAIITANQERIKSINFKALGEEIKINIGK